MRKPRVGFFIPRLGIIDRGAEVFVYELARRLQGDFDVIVWVRKSRQRSELLEDLVKMGVFIKKVSCVSEKHFIARFPYTFPFLRKLLDMFHLSPREIEMLSFSSVCLPGLFLEKVDVLFPVSGIWGSIICRIVRAVKGTPFVYATLGGIESISARQKPDAFITLFPTITNWFKTNYPRLKVVFTPTGVDLKKFSPSGKRVVINLPRPIFITVSAFVPEKQVDLTIRAFAKLKKGSLLVVGDGPLKQTLVELAENILGKDRFLFLRANHQDLPKYYRSADVFAFSAPWEVGWSIVHLEALASGLPVVANREKNLEYLLGKDWPFFCDVGDVDDYSNKLAKATKIKVNSRQLVKGYSWDKIALEYKRVLMFVISSKN